MFGKSGVYALYWECTDKLYIGQTISIPTRYRQHINLLEKRKHYNYKLQEAYDLFGPPTYIILKYCTPSLLNTSEIELISEFNSVFDGYNILHGGDSNYGENHPNSLYTNAQIEKVFLKLLDRTIPQKDISKSTGVSLDVIKAVSRGSLHGWLQEKYPKEYISLIESKKDQHNSGEKHSMSKHTNREIEDLFLNYLVDRLDTLTNISKASGIEYNIVSLVACGKSHKWLKDKYPEQYTKMISNIGKVVNNYPLITNGSEVVVVENGTQFCRERGLSLPNLCKVFKGVRIQHKGWRLYNG